MKKDMLRLLANLSRKPLRTIWKFAGSGSQQPFPLRFTISRWCEVASG